MKCLFSLLVVVLIAGVWLDTVGQPRGRPAPHMRVPGELNEGEGREILEAFRRTGIPVDYSFLFELELIPRRGETVTVPGQMWGGWREGRPVTRIHLQGGDSGERRLIQYSGEEAETWVVDEAGEEPRELGAQGLHRAIAGDLTVTPFDLGMSFIFWKDYVYEGPDRVKGRPAHHFILYPSGSADVAEGPAAVRVTIDARFNALLRGALLDEEGNETKVFKINGLKKVDEVWIVKEIDVLETETRNKTRFRVRAAKMNFPLGERWLDPSQLDEDPPVIPSDSFTWLRS